MSAASCQAGDRASVNKNKKMFRIKKHFEIRALSSPSLYTRLSVSDRLEVLMEIKNKERRGEGGDSKICIQPSDQSHFSLQIKLTFPEAVVAGQIQRDSF